MRLTSSTVLAENIQQFKTSLRTTDLSYVLLWKKWVPCRCKLILCTIPVLCAVVYFWILHVSGLTLRWLFSLHCWNVDVKCFIVLDLWITNNSNRSIVNCSIHGFLYSSLREQYRFSACIRWCFHWVYRALSRSHRTWNRTRDCRTRDAFRLGTAQRVLCTQNLDLMPAVTRAARSTTDICQQLFADKRWNCSSILLAPRFTPDLTGGITIDQCCLIYSA